MSLFWHLTPIGCQQEVIGNPHHSSTRHCIVTICVGVVKTVQGKLGPICLEPWRHSIEVRLPGVTLKTKIIDTPWRLPLSSCWQGSTLVSVTNRFHGQSLGSRKLCRPLICQSGILLAQPGWLSIHCIGFCLSISFLSVCLFEVCPSIRFLAVHNSSIGLIVPCSVCLTKLTIRVFTTLQSDPRDLWPLRHLIRHIFGRFSDF